MTKPVAVEGCTLTLSPGTGTATITSAASTKAKADGKGVYRGTLQISISGYTSSVITVAGSGSGSGTLDGTSQTTKVEGQTVVLEGDQATITVNGQATAGSSTVPASEPVTVTIQNAGQNKWTSR